MPVCLWSPLCAARPSFSTLKESASLRPSCYFVHATTHLSRWGSHFGPCIHLTCSSGAEGQFGWLEWPRSQAGGLPQLGRVPGRATYSNGSRRPALLRVKALSTLVLSLRQAAAYYVECLVRNAGIKMASPRLTTHLARTGF